jgi:hypothetical protein
MTCRIFVASCLALLVLLAAGCGGRSTSEGPGTTFAVETVEADTVGTTRHCCYLCFQALEVNRPVEAGAKLPCR